MVELMSKIKEVSSDVMQVSLLGFSLFENFFHNIMFIEGKHIKSEVPKKLRDCNILYYRIRI